MSQGRTGRVKPWPLGFTGLYWAGTRGLGLGEQRFWSLPWLRWKFWGKILLLRAPGGPVWFGASGTDPAAINQLGLFWGQWDRPYCHKRAGFGSGQPSDPKKHQQGRGLPMALASAGNPRHSHLVQGSRGWQLSQGQGQDKQPELSSKHPGIKPVILSKIQFYRSQRILPSTGWAQRRGIRFQGAILPLGHGLPAPHV